MTFPNDPFEVKRFLGAAHDLPPRRFLAAAFIGILLAGLLIFAAITFGSAPPPTQINLPNGNYKPGTYTLPETILPTGISKFTIIVTGTKDIGITIDLRTDLSSDGGSTWSPSWCANVFVATGDSSSQSFARCYCNAASGCNPANVNRVRGTVIISGGTFSAKGATILIE